MARGEVYCLCNASFIYEEKGSINMIVLPPAPVRCIKTGATQLDNQGSNRFENLDVFECEHCHMRIAKR